jgi:hypothetical protein
VVAWCLEFHYTDGILLFAVFQNNLNILGGMLGNVRRGFGLRLLVLCRRYIPRGRG